MLMSLSKGLRGVGGALVGVQDYLWGLLLIFLICQQLQLLQTVVIRTCAALDRCCLVGEDLVVEGICKERPFPIFPIVFAYRHIGNNDFNGTICVPVSLHFIRERNVFFIALERITGLFAAFMCQIVRKYPVASNTALASM